MPQDGKLPVEEGYQNRVAAPASAATEGREIPSFCGNKAIEGGYHYAINQYTNHCINHASLSTSCSSHPTRGGWIEICAWHYMPSNPQSPTPRGVGLCGLKLHCASACWPWFWSRPFWGNSEGAQHILLCSFVIMLLFLLPARRPPADTRYRHTRRSACRG